MKGIFKVETTDGHWWEGKISVRYNLKSVFILLLLIAGVGIAAYGLYWLGIALWAFAKWAWVGICWVASKWMWVLGAGSLALLIWLLTKIKWPKWENKERKVKIWPFILGILFILLALLCIKQCGGKEEGEKISQEMVLPAPTPTPEQRFEESFDWVVTSRAYLDGVQEGTSGRTRALVGLKFVDGKPVTKQTFEGRTYEESVRVIAQDWQGLILESVGDAELSENQLVAITLFAMRNGKGGFKNSDFLKEIQNGNISGASAKMALHKANGKRRQLGNEARQYLWVLKQVYDGNVDYKQLLEMPIMSYKALPLNLIYDTKGRPVFSDDALSIMKNGEGLTPRKALEL